MAFAVGGLPAASMNTARGTLAATFQVETDDAEIAALIGSMIYWLALAAAGIKPPKDSRVEVSLVEHDDETERFRVVLERESAAA